MSVATVQVEGSQYTGTPIDMKCAEKGPFKLLTGSTSSELLLAVTVFDFQGSLIKQPLVNERCPISARKTNFCSRR